MKRITILGSTGSIGTTTLKIIKANRDKFKIIGLSTNQNVKLLREQINLFEPEEVYVSNETEANLLSKEYPTIKIYTGKNGLIKLCQNKKVDLIIQALSGIIGLDPTIECIKQKKKIALANKEVLVSAGKIIMELAKKNNVNVLPIDSEHSAIYQCLVGYSNSDVSKIILTGSGGAFLNYNGDFSKITIKQALKHPRWKMGSKITIDSATLMNKGFEFIEAMNLFNIPPEKIEILIHPQSIIHSMVQFNDGVVIAQLAPTDMLFPIQYALFDTIRSKNNFSRLNFNKIKTLTFQKPNYKKFPCLKLAINCALKNGLYPAILCMADEIAVSAFLDGKIKFTDIYYLLSNVVKHYKNNKEKYNLNDVYAAMDWSKNYVNYLLTKY